MKHGSFFEAQGRALAAHGVEAESRSLDLPGWGGQAHVLVAGEGPPVLLVNGLGLPAAFWAPLAGRLSGYTLYAVDMPGFGPTDSPPGFCGPSFRVAAAGFLLEVVNALGLPQRLPIIGNSLGSLWSTWLALDHPEAVSALVHIGCPALALGTSAPLPMRLMSVPGLGALLMRLQPPSAAQVEQLSRLVGEDLAAAPIMRDLLLEAERLPDHGRSLREMLGVLLSLGGARPEYALTAAQLGQVRQPVLLVWGERDPFGALDVAEAAFDALPQARLEVVPGGHAPWLDSAEQIAAHVQGFLDGLDIQAAVGRSSAHQTG